MSSTPPLVSIVIPVKNEERILGRCLDAIHALDYPPGCVEVIVADSLSTDAGRRIAEEQGAKVVPNAGQTVVAGRNRGFEVAQGEFVAFTDADCIVRRDWLQAGLDAFRSDAAIAGVGGLTLFPGEASPFQEAVNTLFRLAGFFGSTVHLQSAASTEYVDDIPGCNAMYRRSALAAVMPVDERLLTAEDVWMNRRLRAKGFKLVLAPGMVLWHNRRSRPRSFYRQMYRFAIGRLQVAKRDRTLLRPLHIVAGLSLPVLLAVLVSGHWLILLAGYPVGFLTALFKSRSVWAAALFPLVLGIFLVAWSLGFLRELVFPLTKADGK
jgi:cellulose synthase/poly-beta-1,6-N-acetylglucosamine synthase-like glycosyltransferase